MSVNGIGSAGSVSQIIALRQQILDRNSLLQELQQAKQAGRNRVVARDG